MGNKWEVHVWVKDEVFGYHNEQFWGGRNPLIAIYMLWMAHKKTDAGCIKLEWRP